MLCPFCRREMDETKYSKEDTENQQASQKPKRSAHQRIETSQDSGLRPEYAFDPIANNDHYEKYKQKADDRPQPGWTDVEHVACLSRERRARNECDGQYGDSNNHRHGAHPPAVEGGCGEHEKKDNIEYHFA